MASFTQSVRKDGAGEYTDLVSGIVGILASGVAATGVYTELNLLVDSGYYAGSFSAEIPFSGSLNIIGSGAAWFEPTATCSISGYYDGESNFSLRQFRVIGSGISSALFSIYPNTQCEFNSVNFIETANGFVNSGILILDHCNAHGDNTGTLAVSPTGSLQVFDSSICYYAVGLSGIYVICQGSELFDNQVGVSSSSEILLDHVLIEGSSGILMSCTSGTAILDNVTIDTNWQCMNLTYVPNVRINKSIFETASSYSITGSTVSGVINNCCFNTAVWNPALSLSGLNNFSSDPEFHDTTVYDYRLNFRDTIGSPCIEVADQGILASGVTVNTEQSQLVFSDKRGNINSQLFSPFVYKQGNTLLFSDYGREELFGDILQSYYPELYQLYTRLTFTVYNPRLIPAIDANKWLFPFDWDFKRFDTTEITSEHEYVIPRSVFNVSQGISGLVGEYFNSVLFDKIDKSMIVPYLNKDLRGVSFDFDASTQQNPVAWVIEGSNQILNKITPYNGETLESYPLLVSTREKTYIYPSGLIPAGVYKDKYKYLLESNPQEEFFSDSDDGRFKWIATGLDEHKDVRGILGYKGNLFITISDYSNPIEDRTTTPTGLAVGKILMYSNNNTFEHYIANYTMDKAPVQLLLASGNDYPTDITVYEDGTFYIADYLNPSGLYQYKPAYDYALMQSSYDRESLVILRENYENVEL